MHYNAEPATANRRILDVFEWDILDDIASASADFRRQQ